MKNSNQVNPEEMENFARDVQTGEIRDAAEMREGSEQNGFFQGGERE